MGVLAVRVYPIINRSIMGLCFKPYPGHPHGCPAAGKTDRCPPLAPDFDKAFDLSRPVYAVVNEFDLGAHATRMLAKHPKWSDRQCRCVLYWQGTARKQLKEKIEKVLANPALAGYGSTWCPEGMGVNVTETMKAAGVVLEWPPERIARQVAFIAVPIGD